MPPPRSNDQKSIFTSQYNVSRRLSDLKSRHHNINSSSEELSESSKCSPLEWSLFRNTPLLTKMTINHFLGEKGHDVANAQEKPREEIKRSTPTVCERIPLVSPSDTHVAVCDRADHDTLWLSTPVESFLQYPRALLSRPEILWKSTAHNVLIVLNRDISYGTTAVEKLPLPDIDPHDNYLRIVEPDIVLTDQDIIVREEADKLEQRLNKEYIRAIRSKPSKQRKFYSPQQALNYAPFLHSPLHVPTSTSRVGKISYHDNEHTKPLLQNERNPSHHFNSSFSDSSSTGARIVLLSEQLESRLRKHPVHSNPGDVRPVLAQKISGLSDHSSITLDDTDSKMTHGLEKRTSPTSRTTPHVRAPPFSSMFSGSTADKNRSSSGNRGRNETRDSPSVSTRSSIQRDSPVRKSFIPLSRKGTPPVRPRPSVASRTTPLREHAPHTRGSPPWDHEKNSSNKESPVRPVDFTGTLHEARPLGAAPYASESTTTIHTRVQTFPIPDARGGRIIEKNQNTDDVRTADSSAYMKRGPKRLIQASPLIPERNISPTLVRNTTRTSSAQISNDVVSLHAPIQTSHTILQNPLFNGHMLEGRKRRTFTTPPKMSTRTSPPVPPKESQPSEVFVAPLNSRRVLSSAERAASPLARRTPLESRPQMDPPPLRTFARATPPRFTSTALSSKSSIPSVQSRLLTRSHHRIEDMDLFDLLDPRTRRSSVPQMDAHPPLLVTHRSSISGTGNSSFAGGTDWGMSNLLESENEPFLRKPVELPAAEPKHKVSWKKKETGTANTMRASVPRSSPSPPNQLSVSPSREYPRSEQSSIDQFERRKPSKTQTSIPRATSSSSSMSDFPNNSNNIMTNKWHHQYPHEEGSAQHFFASSESRIHITDPPKIQRKVGTLQSRNNPCCAVM